MISIQFQVSGPLCIEINNSNSHTFFKFAVLYRRLDALNDCTEGFCLGHEMPHFYGYYDFNQVQSFFYVNFVFHNEINYAFCQNLRSI